MFLKQQLDAVFEDIYPDAVKIGMVSSSELIHVIAEKLRYYHAKNVVVDSVMMAPDAPCPVRLRRILQKDLPLQNPYKGRKIIFLGHWKICLIWEKVQDR